MLGMNVPLASAVSARSFDSIASRRKAQNFPHRIRHNHKVHKEPKHHARYDQIHSKTQTLHLQQTKSFFRTSSPLIHNQGSAKLGNSEVNLKHPRRIQTALEPPAQGNVNKLFKHANTCEMKSQSIEIQLTIKQSSASIERFQQNIQANK
jgi:hypothetical protein